MEARQPVANAQELILLLREINEISDLDERVNVQIAHFKQYKSEQLHAFFYYPREQDGGMPWSLAVMELACEMMPETMVYLRHKISSDKNVPFEDMLPGANQLMANFNGNTTVGGWVHLLYYMGDLTPKLARVDPGRIFNFVVGDACKYVSENSPMKERVTPLEFFNAVGGLQLMFDAIKKEYEDRAPKKDVIKATIPQYFQQIQNCPHVDLDKVMEGMVELLRRNFDYLDGNNEVWTHVRDGWLDLYSPEHKIILDNKVKQAVAPQYPAYLASAVEYVQHFDYPIGFWGDHVKGNSMVTSGIVIDLAKLPGNK